MGAIHWHPSSQASANQRKMRIAGAHYPSGENSMDMSLFTSFEGRINRAKWWLGVVILIIVQGIVYYIIASAMGIDRLNEAASALQDPAADDATVCRATKSFIGGVLDLEDPHRATFLRYMASP